jgi:SAM-dependent methyltransferase
MQDDDSNPQHLDDLIVQMKTDWDWRARENAKWFINTFKVDQSDDEFFETGYLDFERVVLNDLPLLTASRYPKSLRVLEIGCGIGRMTRHLADHFGEVCGVDVSAEMIKLGREKLRDWGNVKLFETSGVDFAAFPDDYFDLIISLHVFQHCPEKRIVSSSVRDAYRVLNRGGIFKFVTSGITNEEFTRAPKNTWEGVGFSGEEVRAIAREMGAQLMGVTGEGTQYCWTLLRKRLCSGPSALGSAPRIVGFDSSLLSPRTEASCLTLLVGGIDAEEVDCSSLDVELGGRWLSPCYAGPRKTPNQPEHEPVQVDLLVPNDEPEGSPSIRVRFLQGEPSNAVSIRMPPPQLKIPRIHLVTNVPDGGTDLYAEGPGSRIRLLVHNLEERVRPEDLKILVNGVRLFAESVEFIPGNAAWLITVQLWDVEVGPAEMRVVHKSNESPGYHAELR